jgi:hypothetical protein
MAGRQERVEPLDRAYDLSSFSSEVEAVAWGDRSMQQCRLNTPKGRYGRHPVQKVVTLRSLLTAGGLPLYSFHKSIPTEGSG